jgi:membrane protein implicated in regulation of membrane protease activity
MYAAMRGNPPGIEPGIGGTEGVAIDRIEPGGSGRVELRGSVWRAHNKGNSVIEPGATVYAESTSGVVLDVRTGA